MLLDLQRLSPPTILTIYADLYRTAQESTVQSDIDALRDGLATLTRWYEYKTGQAFPASFVQDLRMQHRSEAELRKLANEREFQRVSDGSGWTYHDQG